MSRTAVVAAVLPLLCAAPAAAQSWVNTVSGNWSVGTNWSGGVVPSSLSTTQLTFGMPITAGYTAINDTGINPFVLNGVTILNDSPVMLTIENTAANGLQFAGTNPFIAMSRVGSATLSGTTIDLTSNMNVIGAGGGVLIVASQVIGAGGLMVARTSPSFMAMTALTGANTYAGTTTLASGVLSVGTATALGTGGLTVETTGSGFGATGDLRASAAVTLANPVTLTSGATLNVLTGSTITFGSAISGGALNIGTPVTAGGVVLRASSPLTALTVPGGSITLNSAGAIPTGNLTIPVGRGGTVALDNVTGANVVNRLAPTTTLSLARGVFTMSANATAGNGASQTLAAIVGEGQNVLTINPSAANSTLLAVGDLARQNRGSFFVGFSSPGGSIGGTPGTANVSTVTFTNINGAGPAAALVGGGGAAGSANISILPFVVADTNSGGSGNTFATYDAANGLHPLSVTLPEYARLSLARQANVATNNVRLVAADTLPGVAAPTTVNALALAGASIYGYGALTGELNVTSGAILASTTGNQVLATGTLNFGAAEGHFFLSASPLVVYSQVTGTNGLTLSGASSIISDNQLQLLNPNNTFTGPVTINAGRLTIRDNSALGNAANVVALNGGILDVQTFNGTIPRAITVGAAGGAITSQAFGGSTTGSGQRLTLSGPITGTGPLRINATPAGTTLASATVILTGNNVGYTGEMAVDAGILQVGSDAALGGGSRFLLSGGTLWATGPGFTTNKTLDIDTDSIIRTDAGTTLTLNGRINPLAASPLTVGLTKIGDGALVLNAPASYGGTTRLGNFNDDIPGGDLVLQEAGALTSTGIYTLNGARIILANGGVNSTNRLANANIAIRGGGLRLEGNASADSSEVVGTLQASTGVHLDIVPVGTRTATLVFTTTSGAQPLAVSADGTLIVSGAGLAPAGQSRVHVLAPNLPVLTNNILPGVFGNDGATVGQMSTAPITGGVALRLLDPAEYVGAFTGAAATANVRITGAETVGAAGTVNSGIVAGTTLTVAGGASLTLTTGNLIVTPGSALAGSGQIRGGANTLRVYTPGSATDVITSSVDLGTGVLSKTGPAILELTGPISPAVFIYQGTVRIGTGGALSGPFATVFVQARATLDLNGNSTALPFISGVGTIQLGTNPATTLTVGTNGNTDFDGTVLGSGTIVKVGVGLLQFGYAANVTQPILVNRGEVLFGSNQVANPPYQVLTGGDVTMADFTTLTLGPLGVFERNININVGTATEFATVRFAGAFGTSTSMTGNILVAAGKTLNLSTTTTGQVELTGNISGGGSVAYTSATNLTLSGNNTYTGTTTISSSGVIAVGSDTAFGSGTVNFTAATNALATFNGNRTLSNPVTFGGAVTLAGPFDLVFSGSTTLGAAAGTGRMFTVSGGGRLGLTAVANGTTATQLTKTGGGSMTLAGNNTYTGTTTVSAGTLLLLGGARLTGVGAVSVGGAAGTAKAIFGGNGFVAGATTVNATGTLSPGLAAAAGDLAFSGGLTFGPGSTYLWDLTSNSTIGAGTTWDRVVSATGVVTVNPAAVFLPSFVGASTAPSPAEPFWQSVQRWDNVINRTGGSASGTSFVIDNTLWSSGGSFSTVPAVVGNGVALLWTPAGLTVQSWTGSSGTSWNVSGNWSPTNVPNSAAVALYFGVAGVGPVNIAASVQAKSLSFVNPTGGYSLTSSAGQTLSGVSSITVGAAVTGRQTINLAAVPTGSLVVPGSGPAALAVANNAAATPAASPTLVIGPDTVVGAAGGGSPGITVSGTGTTEVSGTVAASVTGGLTVAGPGTLVLSGTANGYSGGTTVQQGTLLAAGDGSLGAAGGAVAVQQGGTLAFTGSTSTARPFNIADGSLSAPAGVTVTLAGAAVGGGTLRGGGTFAVTGGTTVSGATTAADATLTQTGPATFVNVTHGGRLNVPAGLAAPAVLNGFVVQATGQVTVGGGSTVNAADFQSYGAVTLAPGTAAAPARLVNAGTAPLFFNGGSRTDFGTPATAGQTAAGVDLNGRNAVVAGGLLVNNGFVVDSAAGSSGRVVADFGALVKGAGFYQHSVVTQNGGRFQAGNSPGEARFGSFTFGPGGVGHYVFSIDDADGPAGLSSGLVTAVRQDLAGVTTSGDFTWTATPAAKVTVALETLLAEHTTGPMADFDPARAYSWPAVRWDGSYDGPADAAALAASTAFDTADFANPVGGVFGWSLDPAGRTLSVTYTPVPEPAALVMAGLAAASGWAAWRRRRRPANPCP